MPRQAGSGLPLGAGPDQAAAGNHTHARDRLTAASTLTTFWNSVENNQGRR